MFINKNLNNLMENDYHLSRKVIMIHPITLNIIRVFNSAIEASRLINLIYSHISSVCRGERNHCGGYYWKYLDEYIKELNGEYYIKCYPQSNNLFNNKFICDPFDFIIYNNLSNYIQPCYNYRFIETWKDIIGYKGLYKVSNWGRIISLQYYPYIYEIKPILNIYGYYQINLYDKFGHRKIYRIHRLVAQTFIPNPNNYPFINHKNEIKTDNRSENLEWCTHLYNCNYGTRTERMSITQGKKIQQIDLITNKIINEFLSISEASRITNIHRENIIKVLKNERKSAGKFGWRFKRQIYI